MAKALLNKDAFAAARRFIETAARPLEVARFRYAFYGAPVRPVLDALAAYQNPDGGFGRALEPDLRTPDSSALCTSVAFQVLRSVEARSDGPLVAGAVAYLLATLDRQEQHWRIIPRSAQSSPHAPWWDQAGREQALDAFSLNPTAEILGYLYDYRRRVPKGVIPALSRRVIGCLDGLREIEAHELLCCLRLLKTRRFSVLIYTRIRNRLSRLAGAAVAWDPARWGSYCLRPVQVLDEPDSALLTRREQAVAANLDYEIRSQNEDGSWTPTWSWGGAFPDQWELARREWAGVITLQKLLLLERFGRIDWGSA